MYDMPSKDDPRLLVRFGLEDWAVVDGAAAAVGVSTGALVREAAVRAARDVAREVREGRLVLRGRNGEASAVRRSSVAAAPEPRPVVDPGVARVAAFRRATGNA